MGASCSVAVFWLGELLFWLRVLVDCRAVSLAFGAFSLKKKSFVFRNSKSLFNATGSDVTFARIVGSSRAPSLEALKAKKAKAKTANLIRLIKPGFEQRVNAQRICPIRLIASMELAQI